MIDTDTWDAYLGWCWPERERMLYLKDHNPRLYPGPYDEVDEFSIVDPEVAASVAGPLLSISWHGAPDSAIDVG